MGCDIHAYVEYHAFGEGENEYWDCIMTNIGDRDYTFFSLIANCGRGEHQPIVPNRGLPEGKLSWRVDEEMYMRIAQEPEQEQWENYVSRAAAERWGRPIEKVGNCERIENPDLHSHTWLTRDELAQVIGRFMTEVHEDYCYSVVWDAALAAMTALEERGHKTRMVIAFDN